MADSPSGRGSDPRKRTTGAGSRGAGRRTPRSTSSARAGARPSAGPGSRRGVPRQRTASDRAVPARPRFTGRAAILVLVLALLMVSYASSMRAYLDQRRHLAELRASIATSQVQVDRLSREKKRWKDPAYVRTVAHQRFGWVMPGEIGFQVLDKDGKPLDPTDTLPTARAATEASRPLWWQSAWRSVVVSGKTKAERTVPPPASKIDAPKVPKTDKTGS
jgi:cell division protein FtsB